MSARLRVLLVDQASPARDRIAEALRELPGLEIVGEAGDVAGATCMATGTNPDAIILDIDLPGRSGIELLATLRKCAEPLVIIVLSSFDVPILRRRCTELGADFYFYKPEELEWVVEVCRNLLKQRMVLEPGVSSISSHGAEKGRP